MTKQQKVMTREEYNKLPSSREHPCPDCGSYATYPPPGCHCPPNANGYGTMHINLNHHTCEPRQPSREQLEADSKKLREPATCNAGHKSNLPVALWDCPVCTQLLRDKLQRVEDKARELAEFLFYSTGQWDDENHRPAIPGTKNLDPTPEMLDILVERAREVEAALKGSAQ